MKQNKKRILFIANTSWYLYNFKMGLMKRLSDIGYEIILIAPKSDIEFPFELNHITISGKGTNPFQDAKLFNKLFRLIKYLSPDLIINYTIKCNIYGALAASLLKVPSIINIAGLGTTFRKKSLASILIRTLYKISSERADFIFFQNPDDQKIFNKLSKNNNYEILPGSGVDLKVFKPDIREENEVFTFLFLGRLLKEKGIYELIEATRRVKNRFPIVLKILGFTDVENPTAITKEEVQGWHNEGIIQYMGFTNNVRDFILDSDCVVLPSYYGEGVPKSLLEAAAMGKPILTTDHIGCKEAVDDGVSGLLCKPRSVDDLSNKMIDMAQMSREVLKQMGENGREKMIKEFDEEIVISSNINQIEKIIGEA